MRTNKQRRGMSALDAYLSIEERMDQEIEQLDLMDLMSSANDQVREMQKEYEN